MDPMQGFGQSQPSPSPGYTPFSSIDPSDPIYRLLDEMSTFEDEGSAQPNREHFGALDVIQNEIGNMYERQRSLPVPFPSEVSRELNNQLEQLLAMCRDHLQKLDTSFNTTLLSSDELSRRHNLNHEFNRNIKLLQLQQKELHFYTNYSPNNMSTSSCFAELVITKQPPTKTVKKNSNFCSTQEEPIFVELLKAPKAECSPIGKVNATVINPKSRTGRDAKLQVIGGAQPMDENGAASFSDIKFTKGTRKSPVHLRFRVEVEYITAAGSPMKTHLDSENTEPFIIATNENQWLDTEGILLQGSIFNNRTDVSWYRFANMFQIHYLQASRRDQAYRCRALTPSDFHHIHSTCFKEQMNLTKSSFPHFWNSIGPIMKKIRFHKIFSRLWKEGLVIGFISKQISDQLLRQYPLKTVLIRFSDSKPGAVALAYSRCSTNGQFEIGHKLIDADVIPEMLLAMEDFQAILKLNFDSNGNIDVYHQWTVVNKFDALSSYCQKTKSDDLPSGYEEILSNEVGRVTL